MKLCELCRVKVRGKDKVCPMCQNVLTDGKEEEIYPYVPTIYEKYHILFKWLLFASFILSFLCLCFEFLFQKDFSWSLYVAAGLFCAIFMLRIVLNDKYSFHTTLVRFVIIGSILMLLWDYFTGWHRWSISVVIPILCVIGSINITILSYISKDYVEEYLGHFLILFVLGLIPILFLITGWVSIIYPSLICVCLNLISFVILAFFKWENLIQEMKRRLHL